MFAGHGLDPARSSTPYTAPGVLALVVVSEDALEHVRHVFPRIPAYRTWNAIDPAFHPPDGPKRQQVCFMPRKHPDEAVHVLQVLRLRGALAGWSVASIHNATLGDVARVVRESAVFLSFGYPEGFGLPPAEAMAAGCVVVGYHGWGGREYFTPERGFPVEAADLLAFSRVA